jgi:hypothetical protein
VSMCRGGCVEADVVDVDVRVEIDVSRRCGDGDYARYGTVS